MILLLLLAIPALCTGEIYKWVDDKGRVGFSDDMGKVPAKYRDKVITSEKQDQGVEVIEKTEPGKAPRKGGDNKTAVADDKVKNKEKALYDGKSGEAWKQDFSRQKNEIKSLEDQSTGLKERMAEGGKITRGEYLALQNTQRDVEVRLTKAKKKLESLTQAADKAEVPTDFR